MSFSQGPWTQVGAHTAYARLEPHGVNVGLVVGSERAALIDAGSTPNQGRDLLAAAEAHAGVPVTHVVITHPHHDHWFGAAGMAGVSVVAHENLDTAVEDEVATAAAEIGLADLPTADRSFSIVTALDLGGVRLEAMHFGPAHTNADVMVVVPEDHVIFMGDLIEEAGDPQFGPSGDTASWPKVLDTALGASHEGTTFVPGHGHPVDREFCFRQRAEIAMVHGTAQHLLATGVRLEDAYAAATWPFREATMQVALPLIYARLRASGIRPQLPLV